MSEEGVERRLTTILAADVVGYSRLMAADEAGTLTSLKALRRELIEPKTAEHHGRVVKAASPTTRSQSWMNSCRGVTLSIERNRLCPTTQGRGRRTVTSARTPGPANLAPRTTAKAKTQRPCPSREPHTVPDFPSVNPRVRMLWFFGEADS